MKKLFVVLAVAMFVLPARADEGMWLLPYLERMNIRDMKAKGLKLSAEDIYSVKKSSLKDAVVIFGGGCTGEIVSAEGLLFTNHHCGYGSIQQLSSVEHDYLKNGYWAMNRAEEIPAAGLAVRFIRRIEDVTAEVVGEAATMAVGLARDSVVAAGVKVATEKYKELYPDMTVVVQPFMGGNQYFMTVMEVFRDVRLVGTPPSSMGKFGGDTDNWMWPRHTDDFSMWRVYASPDNKPAAYSTENVPYKAPTHLKISTKGYKEGDFAMILGFPGSTERYMTSFEMQQMMDVENANRIYIRGERQRIIMEDMLADDHVRLKYAAKYASSSNYWKNAMGMNKALVENEVMAAKLAGEEAYKAWAEGQKGSVEQYELALPRIAEAVEGKSKIEGVWQYFREAFLSGTEIISVPRRVKAVVEVDENGKITNIDKVKEVVEAFYKDYNEPTDRRVAKRMFRIVRENVAAADLPSIYAKIDADFAGCSDAYVDSLYNSSIYACKEKLTAALENYDQAAFDADPALELMNSVNAEITKLGQLKAPYDQALAQWHRVYVKGLGAMNTSGKYYPDANFSMRLTYGQVLPYEPRDGVLYKYYTTLAGVIEKEDSSNPLEFTVPEKVKEAYVLADYGAYGQNGELRVNFLSNNDITGGNSGSPVLNARGELIGLAFDGNWEALSGDIVFDPTLQRCINLDVRYLLWTIDRFGGAGYLLDEMTLVK
ncbi:MAG: S46 family peptidase [Rikenellaceae bacterium]|jgi:hypothetical protein|nr:S46 family peptidase [Rikenellaceae bacterium]